MDPITLDAQIAVALEEYNPARAALAELGAEYRKLTTNGREDRAAFNAVVKARRDVKSKRVAVEKTRKALKAGALEYGRAVDGAAKELTAELLAIETHLQAQESLVTDEEKRIEREAEEARQKKVRARMDAFAAVGCQALPLEVEIDGKRRPLTKTERYALVGNSVPPRWAELLAQLNVRRALTMEAAE
jgi:site-specific DNA-cytosine methylase